MSGLAAILLVALAFMVLGFAGLVLGTRFGRAMLLTIMLFVLCVYWLTQLQ
jgi:hypothetical protein